VLATTLLRSVRSIDQLAADDTATILRCDGLLPASQIITDAAAVLAHRPMPGWPPFAVTVDGAEAAPLRILVVSSFSAVLPTQGGEDDTSSSSDDSVDDSPSGIAVQTEVPASAMSAFLRIMTAAMRRSNVDVVVTSRRMPDAAIAVAAHGLRIVDSVPRGQVRRLCAALGVHAVTLDIGSNFDASQVATPRAVRSLAQLPHHLHVAAGADPCDPIVVVCAPAVEIHDECCAAISKVIRLCTERKPLFAVGGFRFAATAAEELRSAAEATGARRTVLVALAEACSNVPVRVVLANGTGGIKQAAGALLHPDLALFIADDGRCVARPQGDVIDFAGTDEHALLSACHAVASMLRIERVITP
jgi:hypothetical protein